MNEVNLRLLVVRHADAFKQRLLNGGELTYSMLLSELDIFARKIAAVTEKDLIRNIHVHALDEFNTEKEAADGRRRSSGADNKGRRKLQYRRQSK